MKPWKLKQLTLRTPLLQQYRHFLDAIACKTLGACAGRVIVRVNCGSGHVTARLGDDLTFILTSQEVQRHGRTCQCAEDLRTEIENAHRSKFNKPAHLAIARFENKQVACMSLGTAPALVGQQKNPLYTHEKRGSSRF